MSSSEYVVVPRAALEAAGHLVDVIRKRVEDRHPMRWVVPWKEAENLQRELSALDAASPSTPRLGGEPVAWDAHLNIAEEVIALLQEDVPAFDAYDEDEIAAFETSIAMIVRKHVASPTSGENGVREALEKIKELSSPSHRIEQPRINLDQVNDLVRYVLAALSASPAGGES